MNAQQVTTLIQFTNVWKYNDSGLELGTGWRTNDYDDSEWQSGSGLLGAEDGPASILNYTQHAPIITPLPASTTVTTYYFRTKFEFDGPITNGLSLVTTNLLDDGCVIYLNGLPAGAIRAPTNPGIIINATTFFGGPAAEGQLDVVTLTNLAALNQGANQLAVEVHQVGIPNSDIMWGMKLMAIQQTPLVITNQPHGQRVMVGEPVTLSVGVSGGPAFYQWQRNGVNIPSGTNATYLISDAQPANAGDYRIGITNSISAVTSSVATITVLADTTGPKLLWAVANNVIGSSPFPTNTINVFFNEAVSNDVAGAGVRNTNNYTLAQLGTTNTVPILSILYSTALGALLYVDTADEDWIPGGEYVLTVNHVRDIRGNVIAPDSQVPVSWPRLAKLLDSFDPWHFHNSWFFDPDTLRTNWYACDFVEGPWWAEGRGPFCGGVFGTPPNPCLAICQTETGFQPAPTLFRTWFDWPENLSTAGVTLHPRFAVDDGAVFYLNGVEIYRRNMPEGPVTDTTRAATIIATPPACVTNLSLAVSNLVAGSNCLAVAVVQGNSPSDADLVFHLELDVRYLLTPVLPQPPEPILLMTPFDASLASLSWTGGGYALESATNLNFGSDSYPIGPWQQVSNMSNPYPIRLDEIQRFFRLKK
jgi:hypothetical protein